MLIRDIQQIGEIRLQTFTKALQKLLKNCQSFSKNYKSFSKNYKSFFKNYKAFQRIAKAFRRIIDLFRLKKNRYSVLFRKLSFNRTTHRMPRTSLGFLVFLRFRPFEFVSSEKIQYCVSFVTVWEIGYHCF